MDDLLKVLNIKNEQVLNIYLFGSRAYKIHKETSDWDYVFVIKDDYNYERPKNEEVYYEYEQFTFTNHKESLRGMIKYKDINIGLYKLTIFKRLLDEHLIWTLFCINIPEKENVIKESYKFNTLIRYIKLRNSVLMEVGRTWQKAKNLFVKEKAYEKGRKLVFYTFLYLYWGINFKDKKGFSYEEATKVKKEIDQTESNDWEVFVVKFENEYKNLKEYFTENMSHKTLKLSEEYNLENNSRELFELLKFYKVEGFYKEFSIECKIHKNFQDIIILNYIPSESPIHYSCISLCNNLLVDLKNEYLFVSEKEKIVATHFRLKNDSFEIRMFKNNDEWILEPLDERIEIEFWNLWKSKEYELPNEKYSNFLFLFEMVSSQISNLFPCGSSDEIYLSRVFERKTFLTPKDEIQVSKELKYKTYEWSKIESDLNCNIVDLSEFKFSGYQIKDGKNQQILLCPLYTHYQNLIDYLVDLNNFIISPNQKLTELLWNCIKYSSKDSQHILIDLLTPFKSESLCKLCKDIIISFKYEIDRLSKFYDQIKDKNNKDFSIAISKEPKKAILFEMRNKGKDIMNAIRNSNFKL